MEDGRPPPPTEEEKKNSAKILKIANILIVACIIFITVTGGLCLSGTVSAKSNTAHLIRN